MPIDNNVGAGTIWGKAEVIRLGKAAPPGAEVKGMGPGDLEYYLTLTDPYSYSNPEGKTCWRVKGGSNKGGSKCFVPYQGYDLRQAATRTPDLGHGQYKIPDPLENGLDGKFNSGDPLKPDEMVFVRQRISPDQVYPPVKGKQSTLYLVYKDEKGQKGDKPDGIPDATWSLLGAVKGEKPISKPLGVYNPETKEFAPFQKPSTNPIENGINGLDGNNRFWR